MLQAQKPNYNLALWCLGVNILAIAVYIPSYLSLLHNMEYSEQSMKSLLQDIRLVYIHTHIPLVNWNSLKHIVQRFLQLSICTKPINLYIFTHIWTTSHINIRIRSKRNVLDDVNNVVKYIYTFKSHTRSPTQRGWNNLLTKHFIEKYEKKNCQ